MREPYAFTFYTASWYRKSPYWQRTVEAVCTTRRPSAGGHDGAPVLDPSKEVPKG